MSDIDLKNYIERMRQKREAELADQRPKVLQTLKAAGISKVEADYNGYGDSGQVDQVTFEPSTATLTPDYQNRLEDFIWSVAYHLYPGFEINDGADGEIIWDVKADRIDVEHRTNIVERQTDNHENV
jgi:hypothetical protein